MAYGPRIWRVFALSLLLAGPAPTESASRVRQGRGDMAKMDSSQVSNVGSGLLSAMPSTKGEREGRRDVPKYHDRIIFVGQLPYNATQSQVEAFFRRKGLDEFTVRMLTDKSPEKKFRGIAFVEFNRATDASKALKLDHHLFGNRRIRIEQTATGGGNNQKRRGRLLRSKQQREQDRKRQIEGLLDRIFARRDSKASGNSNTLNAELTEDPSVHPTRRQQPLAVRQTNRDITTLMGRQDCDELLVKYLSSLPDKIASKAARACSRLEVSTVENRSAFAMGMIKRKLRKEEKKAKKRLLQLRQDPTPLVMGDSAKVESGFYG